MWDKKGQVAFGVQDRSSFLFTVNGPLASPQYHRDLLYCCLLLQQFLDGEPLLMFQIWPIPSISSIIMGVHACPPWLGCANSIIAEILHGHFSSLFSSSQALKQGISQGLGSSPKPSKTLSVHITTGQVQSEWSKWIRVLVDVDANCAYTGFVEHDVTSLFCMR